MQALDKKGKYYFINGFSMGLSTISVDKLL